MWGPLRGPFTLFAFLATLADATPGFFYGTGSDTETLSVSIQEVWDIQLAPSAGTLHIDTKFIIVDSGTNCGDTSSFNSAVSGPSSGPVAGTQMT